MNGEDLEYRPNEMSLCGANKRYSPPVVQFRDFVQPEHIQSDENESDSISGPTSTELSRRGSTFDEKNIALLLFRVDETTSQSQFLAHYSFTPIGEKPVGTGLHIRGGKVITENTTSVASANEDFQYSPGN